MLLRSIKFVANMDRLRVFQTETEHLTLWGECLASRLESKQLFETSCRRGDKLNVVVSEQSQPNEASNALELLQNLISLTHYLP